MIGLNLLSKQKKEKLKEYKVLNTFKLVSYIILVFIILLLAFLYASSYYISNQIENISTNIEKTQSASPDSEISYSKTIKEINEKINSINNIQSEYVLFSNYLMDFTKLVPSSIKINNLSINQETNVIQLDGYAPIRQNFLQFETNLKNSSIIEKLESPISNLIKKEDINFTLSGQMILDEYKLK